MDRSPITIGNRTRYNLLLFFYLLVALFNLACFVYCAHVLTVGMGASGWTFQPPTSYGLAIANFLTRYHHAGTVLAAIGLFFLYAVLRAWNLPRQQTIRALKVNLYIVSPIVFLIIAYTMFWLPITDRGGVVS